ncbi:DUF5819 family protein [Streptomyces sp. NPDC002690]
MIDDDRGGMESDRGGRSNRLADGSEEPAGEREGVPPGEASPGPAGVSAAGPGEPAAPEPVEEQRGERRGEQRGERRGEQHGERPDERPAGRPDERPGGAGGAGAAGPEGSGSEAVAAGESPGGRAAARSEGATESGAPPAASWPPGTDGHEPAPGPDEHEPGRGHDGESAAPGAAPRGAGEESAEGRERGAGGADGPGGPGPEAGTLSGAASGPARAGIAGLSTPYRFVVGVVMVVVGLFTCVHLAMVFLHVAPSNTLSKEGGETIDDWIYPEFEQNWKLFAPNPLQQNIAVHVRAEIVDADGDRRTTPWMSLSAEDGEAILHNPLPSHANQNELRRAWDFYVNSHDDKNRSTGTRGALAEAYLRRIVMLRLGEHDYGGTVDRIQLRSSSRRVSAPSWSNERIGTQPMYRELAWWTVSATDLPEGSVAAAGAAPGEEADQ